MLAVGDGDGVVAFSVLGGSPAIAYGAGSIDVEDGVGVPFGEG